MLALVLLLSIGLSLWVVLIFPAWVLLISVIVLVRNLNDRPEGQPASRDRGHRSGRREDGVNGCSYSGDFR